jgi:phospholipid/cholesterol/gamma-HCH transport system permease protein
MNQQANSGSNPSASKVTGGLARLGAAALNSLDYIGGVYDLGLRVIQWIVRSLLMRRVRFGRHALYQQLVRVGVRSILIIALVSTAIGIIIVLQMVPPLENYGQKDRVAQLNAIAMLRELGPLISAIVLTGFAGASIAAELGTMVVGEEIEALETMALNPVRFLVVPRVLATMVGLVVLTVFADVIALLAGGAVGVFMLDIPYGTYKAQTLIGAELSDFVTGLIKAAVFGLLIGLIACYNGLKVTGGAAGVGRATTVTVVHSIVSIIFADLVFTTIFYSLEWN